MGPGSTALPPPGPVLSPNDPRYSGRPVYPDQGRPIQSPDDPRYGRPPGLYSDRGPVMSPDDPRYGRPAPPPGGYSGPVMSPDDPRYGRTDPPAVIYADRPAGPPPQPAYDPADDYGRGSRPPGAVGRSWQCDRQRAAAARRRAAGAGQSIRVAVAAGRAAGVRRRPTCRRTCAGRKSISPPRNRRER